MDEPDNDLSPEFLDTFDVVEKQVEALREAINQRDALLITKAIFIQIKALKKLLNITLLK